MNRPYRSFNFNEFDMKCQSNVWAYKSRHFGRTSCGARNAKFRITLEAVVSVVENTE